MMGDVIKLRESISRKEGLSEPGFRDFKGCKDRLESANNFVRQSILTSFKIPKSGFRQSFFA